MIFFPISQLIRGRLDGDKRVRFGSTLVVMDVKLSTAVHRKAFGHGCNCNLQVITQWSQRIYIASPNSISTKF